jgi:TetR/AcrR family transcriptional regulator, transcriptional repressor for nem operon
MSKAENTRMFIAEKAAQVFNVKGYAGTSLADLIEATGLTKGAIYGNFENKDEVAIAAFEHNVAALRRRLDDSVSGKETAAEKLLAITEYYRTSWKQMFGRGGCPMLNASIEADDNLPFLKKHVQKGIRSWAARFTAIIEEGIESREFRRVDSEKYAYTIIMILEGGIMLSNIFTRPEPLFTALDRIALIIETELKK